LQAPLEARGAPQLSRTAPESRALQRGKGRGPDVGDNVQTAVDRKPKRIIATAVPNDPGDRAGRSPMALQAQAVLGCTFDAVADVGDDHGEAVKPCLHAGSTPYVPRPLPSANQQRGLFSQADGTEAGATATSQCPAGEPRTFHFATVELGRHIRYEAPSACRACPLTQQGTRNQGGRRLTRWVEAHRLAAMAQRGRRRPEVMQQRKQLVAHPCGTRQRWGDQGYFWRRGLEKVRTELSVTVLASNLRRGLHIVGLPQLMAARGAVWLLVLSRLAGKNVMADTARLGGRKRTGIDH
jgi:hypothetical protein